ncbi:hypothetical protein [Devosia submarina]|uniref:hypothetical protein n=1 Tax=Devosia submarina TaxID=1173082 RepID=UPI00130028C9|nr:hypothetical protein [Devosia submarina]
MGKAPLQSTGQRRPAAANQTLIEHLPHRLVVGAPVTRSIPVFAMGVEKGRDEVEQTVLTSFRALKHAVGAKAASGLRSGCHGTFRLVQSRSRSGRIATYSAWLEFAEASDANAFLQNYPELAAEANS